MTLLGGALSALWQGIRGLGCPEDYVFCVLINDKELPETTCGLSAPQVASIFTPDGSPERRARLVPQEEKL